jgi:hypothetical protein
MSRLFEKTLELLRDTDYTLKEVAEETGLTYALVQRLRVKNPPTPNVEACERLYCFLSGKQLEL